MKSKTKKTVAKQPKQFSTLKTRLLDMHPSDMRNSDLMMLQNYIRGDENFAKAWRESTPAIQNHRQKKIGEK